MTAALEGGEWSAARPSRTLPPGKTWYPLYRRLGGPQGRSGRAENLVPIGIRSRAVQPEVSRSADWATRPTHTHTHTHIYIYTYIHARAQKIYIYIYIYTLTHLCTFTIISRSILLRIRNVLDESCTENQNTHFMFDDFFPKIIPFMR